MFEILLAAVEGEIQVGNGFRRNWHWLDWFQNLWLLVATQKQRQQSWFNPLFVAFAEAIIFFAIFLANFMHTAFETGGIFKLINNFIIL